MTRRLLISYLSITLFVLVVLEVPLAVSYSGRERDRIEANAGQDANVLASFYEDALEQGEAPDPVPADNYEDRTGARVVVVDTDGISIVDTDQPSGRDFSTRPEIAAALGGGRSSGARRSDTLETDLLYVAVPVASGGVVHGAVRVTIDTRFVTDRIHRFWAALAAVAAIVLAVVAAVGWRLARSLTRPIRHLQAEALRFAGGDLATTAPPPGAVPELRSLAESMNTMAHRLDGVIAAQRVFVADASHQLRTPLTSLRLQLENLQSQVDDPEAGVAIDDLLDEIDRLTTLVADLLRLARAEEHPPPVDVDLAALTASRVDTWSAVADAAGVRLRLDGAPPPLLVRAVPGAVEQILDNLLDNAMNASPPGTSVSVEVDSADADRCRLVVQDAGPGMPDDQKVHAFDRFWRADPSGAGTGLGLAIVEALATASGGSVALADPPGGGLAVTVVLPASGGEGERRA